MAHAHHGQRRRRYATKLRMVTCRHHGHGGDSANGVHPRTYLCGGARETRARDQTFENLTGISQMSTRATRIVCMPDGSNLMRWESSNLGLRENHSSNGGSGYNLCRLPAIKAPERERLNRSILHNQGGQAVQAGALQPAAQGRGRASFWMNASSEAAARFPAANCTEGGFCGATTRLRSVTRAAD